MDDIALLDAPVETPVVTTPAPSAAPAPTPETTPAPEATPAPAPTTTPAEPVNEVEFPDADETDEIAPALAPQPEVQIAAEPDDGKPLIGAERLGTRGFRRLLKENADFAKSVEANPALSNRLHQMARQVDELNQIRAIAPSKADVERMRDDSTSLANFEGLYRGDDPDLILRAMYDAQLERDEATGQVRSTGAYDRMAQRVLYHQLSALDGIGARNNNQNLVNAVKVLRDALGINAASPANGAQPAAADVNTLPASIRQKIEKFDAQERELNDLRARRSEEQTQQYESFMDSAAQDVADDLHELVNGLMANTGISDYDKRNVARDFVESVAKAADADVAFTAQQDEILKQFGHTPDAKARIRAQAQQWARQNGRDIIQPILSQVGVSLKQRTVKAKTAQAVRREPASAAAPSAPRLMDARVQIAEQQKKLGRKLTDKEILDL